MNFDEKLLAIAAECEKSLKPKFEEIDSVATLNTERVLRAFEKNRVSERHFMPTSGYGYNDDGRDLCDRLFADVFGAESGFARTSIISGTQTLAIALFGILRPNDTMLAVSGKPYDTLAGIIGTDGGNGDGSLADFGVKYSQIEMTADSHLDLCAIKKALDSDFYKVVYVQRSRGYDSRRTLSCDEIDELYTLVKGYERTYLVTDNCYGEFCEDREPHSDLLAGSLIKNPGGGIVESGGYIVGTEKAVSLAAARLTVPTVKLEAGACFGTQKQLMKGLFHAPHTVAQAMKTAVFASCLFTELGYECKPKPFDKRFDIIQQIDLESENKLLSFCKGIQSGSPIDSFVTPVGWEMPGYDDSVVMAAGTFTQGSSIELSADGPIRPPYRVFLQGGLTYESGRYGILCAASEILNCK